MEIACKLHIDGAFEGDIISQGTVEIGKSGAVKGNIAAKKLMISGAYVGDADCGAIHLLSGGDVRGSLSASSLTIDANSSFQGESIRRQSSETPSRERPRRVAPMPAQAANQEKKEAALAQVK